MNTDKRAGGGASNKAPRTAGIARNPWLFFGIGTLGLLIAAGVARYFFPPDRPPALSAVSPALSAAAARGAQAFAVSCAGCHGAAAMGTDQGPPLIHRIYEPSHHGDAAFYHAVRMGVTPHHWQFGPMPKVDVADEQLAFIVAYVRELQKANGIF